MATSLGERRGTVCLLVALVAHAGCSGTSTTAPSQTLGGGITPPAALAACPSNIGTALFDQSPIALGDFLAFRPLGFLSPPIHMFPAKHSAFSMTPPGQAAIARPVSAPGRVWVKEIWEATFSTGGANYQLFVYPCTEVRVYLGHVSSLSSKLMAAMQAVAPSCNSFNDGTAMVTTCRHLNMSVMLESGESIGSGPDTAGIDFGVIDFRLPPAGFVRLDHYDAFYPYYASPLNYFPSIVRTQLESRTGHVFGTRMRTASPIGGTYMQDISGTAQGNWFFPGSYYSNNTDISAALGLVTDYVDPSQPLMAIGTRVNGVAMGLYSFSVQSQGAANRAFRDVTADGTTYCYDSFLTGQSTGGLPLSRPPGVLLLALPNATSLRMELVSANSCAAANTSFTSNATMFER